LLDLAGAALTAGAKDHYDETAIGQQLAPALNGRTMATGLLSNYRPKSTGQEYSEFWNICQCLADAEIYQLNPADLLATLTELAVS